MFKYYSHLNFNTQNSNNYGWTMFSTSSKLSTPLFTYCEWTAVKCQQVVTINHSDLCNNYSTFLETWHTRHIHHTSRNSDYTKQYSNRFFFMQHLLLQSTHVSQLNRNDCTTSKSRAFCGEVHDETFSAPLQSLTQETSVPSLGLLYALHY